MNTMDCITSRRSIRKFEDRPVPHEVIEQMVAAAAYAPSWKNTQITRYIAIESREIIDKIADEYAPFNAPILHGAPLLFAVTMITGRSGFERDGSYSTDREDGWQMFDCGIASQTLCLAGHELGIGTVILGIFDRLGLQKYLEIPEGQELVALIPAGYPAIDPTAPRRKTVEDLLTYR
ncbi:MAG: nitroreductase family protein [Eubacteriales bacterium]|jgi:nitroreductase